MVIWKGLLWSHAQWWACVENTALFSCMLTHGLTCHYHLKHHEASLYSNPSVATEMHSTMLHQRAGQNNAAPCAMWYFQECERALHLPPILSWLAAFATLSRLLRDFSSGSAIFLLSLGPLVLFLLPPPLPLLSSLYVPVLLLPGFPLRVPHGKNPPPPPQSPNYVSSPSLIRPFSYTCTQTLLFMYTRCLHPSHWNSSDPDPIPVPPSLCLSKIQQGGGWGEPNLCDDAVELLLPPRERRANDGIAWRGKYVTGRHHLEGAPCDTVICVKPNPVVNSKSTHAGVCAHIRGY